MDDSSGVAELNCFQELLYEGFDVLERDAGLFVDVDVVPQVHLQQLEDQI